MPLPIHLATSGERLEYVREQTALLKHTERPEATQAFVQAAGLVPPPLRTPVVRALATPRQFNLTVSQSPAPRGSLYLLGCELEEVYSVVPIAQGHALAIGMVRYRNELFFGCYADPLALPEVHALPGLLEAELEELAAAAAAQRGGRAAHATAVPAPPVAPATATASSRTGRSRANGRALTPAG